jgi:hypothetical protein
MSHLSELLASFDKKETSDRDGRALIVLKMIEFAVTYPPLGNITEKELQEVGSRVESLMKQYKRRSLFARRVHKIWQRRGHLLKLVEIAHSTEGDYMDVIEYHEEVAWLRDQQRRLIRGEDVS